MSISTSPKPNDGPLSAKGPNIKLTISTTKGATLSAAIKTTSGAFIPIEHMYVNPGTNIVVLSLPPGGVPPGSTLLLVFDENPGAVSVVKYKLE